MTIRQWSVVLTLLAATTLGCSKLREGSVVGPPQEVTYSEDIAPIFQERCLSCHGPDISNASYDLSTYDGVLGPGSDEVPNAIAGDSNSLLVVVSMPGGSMSTLYGESSEADLVIKWVVEDSLAR